MLPVRPLAAFALVLLGALPGCCRDPWSKYPRATPPDRSCSTGVVAGHDVYIWDCVGGQHVVVAQYSGEMYCASLVQETSPRGTLTPLEKELALTPETCAGARPGREWKPRSRDEPVTSVPLDVQSVSAGAAAVAFTG